MGITKQFFDSYNRLSSSVQKRTFDVLETFGTDARRAGSKLEKLKKSASGNTYSIRVDQANRIILGKTGSEDLFVALYVAHHDDAYDWAESHKFETNLTTGTIQIFRTVESATPIVVHTTSPVTTTEKAIFEALSDEDLFKLSVPMEWVPRILQLKSLNELETLENTLPTDTFEALSLIASGENFLDVLDLFNFVPKTPDEHLEPSETVFKPNLGRDIHVPHNIEELTRILEKPLGLWRVFLHPSQEAVVKTNWRGPVRISGGPGTGKTVCALHRVKQILDTHPAARVLFTSFDKFLALDLKVLLSTIISPEEMRRVEAISIDDWAQKTVKKLGIDYTVSSFSEERDFDIWNQLRSKYDVDFSPRFLAEEYGAVILENMVQSVQDYMRVKRIGRGTRLTGSERAALWPLFEEFSDIIKNRGTLFSARAYKHLVDALDSNQLGREFTHIVVDECQDFSGSALRLLSKLPPPDAPQIFLVGDLNQRIRSFKYSFVAMGLSIRGRSKTLKINYRTSRAVYKRAIAIRYGITEDHDESLDGTASLFEGSPPTVNAFPTESDEFNQFFDWLKTERENLADEEICVVTRTIGQLQVLQTRLIAKGISTYQIRGNVFDHTAIPGLRLSTIHRIKGLEFSAVAILNANRQSIPRTGLLENCADEAAKDDAKTRETNAMFVAMTRTRGNLWISGSPDLTNLLS